MVPPVRRRDDRRRERPHVRFARPPAEPLSREVEACDACLSTLDVAHTSRRSAADEASCFHAIGESDALLPTGEMPRPPVRLLNGAGDSLVIDSG